MDTNRFLHCKMLYTDAVSHFNDVWRLPDGRLFTLGAPTKVNQGGHFSKEPVSTFIIGRASSDEGATWDITFIRQLPGETEMTLLGDFIVTKDGKSLDAYCSGALPACRQVCCSSEYFRQRYSASSSEHLWSQPE